MFALRRWLYDFPKSNSLLLRTGGFLLRAIPTQILHAQQQVLGPEALGQAIHIGCIGRFEIKAVAVADPQVCPFIQGQPVLHAVQGHQEDVLLFLKRFVFELHTYALYYLIGSARYDAVNGQAAQECE